MKLVLALFLLLLSGISVLAQELPTNPRITPGRLPVPKNPRLLRPADLQVTALESLSLLYEVVTFPRGDIGSGRYVIVRIAATIKNAGEIMAASTKLGAEIRGGAVGTTWTVLYGRATVSAVNPGQSLRAEYSFYIPSTLMERGPVQFRVKADYQLGVSESNEDNNYSTIISLDPARIIR